MRCIASATLVFFHSTTKSGSARRGLLLSLLLPLLELAGLLNVNLDDRMEGTELGLGTIWLGLTLLLLLVLLELNWLASQVLAVVLGVVGTVMSLRDNTGLLLHELVLVRVDCGGVG
jgi:hypothetical protein